MEDTKKRAAKRIENASRIMESVIEGSKRIVDISEPLLKNEESKAILKPLLLDNNYGIRTYQNRLENKIFRIGILSNQSCGKSFLYNTLLGIPLLPVADVRTSSVKLQIIYEKHCHIDIKQVGVERKACTIDCEKTDRETLKALKEFVCHCYKVIDLKNIWYFLPAGTEEIMLEDAEKLEINPDEPWQVAFLWMILLTTYVNQNENSKELKNEWNCALVARSKMYKNLGLDPELDYEITLYLDNAFLASGISLVDLPGVGAAVKGTKKAKSHDQIATDAVRDTDAIIVAAIKDVVGGAVSEALGSVLKCAQFKYEGSRENRIIPLLVKVDRIKGHNVRHQVDVAKKTIIHDIFSPNGINLKEDDVRCVSALNAEYIFCENVGIPYDRCILVAEGECNTLEDMKKKYEEDSYIPEFSAFLQDYTVQGQVVASSELFAQCVVYAQKCVDILEGQLEDSLISLEFFENISGNILQSVSDIINDSFAETLGKIGGERGIIDHYTKNLEKIHKDLKKEVDTKIHPALEGEIQKAKDDLMEKAKNLHSNFFGDVVLSRKDKKGNITYEPAYHNCVSMIDDFSNTNYCMTQDAILQSMSNAIGRIGEELAKMDEEVVDAYGKLNKEINRLTSQVETRFRDNNLDPNSPFVKTLIDRCKEVVEVNKDIKDYLAFANSTQELEQDFRKESLDIISSFISDMNGIVKGIKDKCTRTGIFKVNTTLVYYQLFVNLLDNEIKVKSSADYVCANINGNIAKLFYDFVSKVNSIKKGPAMGPCENMLIMTAKMKDDLLVNKGNDRAVIREKLSKIGKTYFDFVGTVGTIRSNMCSSFDGICKDSGSLSVLVSRYMEKGLKVKEDLPKRVKNALENN